ncbi:MAG TPA: VCBS repeat-containing protein [Candidatus Sulfotelmatobacter sp.]|nr:VCBS repeat-containing protein [Candidatus Sulfotelmatobacter sp.]
MTRLSATATIAALLLLAIAQGFGATKVTAKAATKSTAKPYHITAQNQFHLKSTQHTSPALARLQSKEQQHQKAGDLNRPRGNGRNAVGRASMQTRSSKPRPRTANPPTGKLGFVSATEVPAGGGGPDQVLEGTWGGSTGFVTVVLIPGCPTCTPVTTSAWNYSVLLNNAGTFSTPAFTPAVDPYVTPYGSATERPSFVVGDVNGDGNTDIVQIDQSGGTVTFTVLLGTATGTFATAKAGVGPASPFTVAPAYGASGGAGVMNATSGNIDIALVDDAYFYNASKPSNLTTYAGNGDGTFGTGTTSPIAAASTTALVAPTGFFGDGYDVIVTDLDGDGIVDVSENDDSSGELAVYLSSAKVPYTGTAVTTPDGVYDACNSTSGSLTGSTGSPAIVETNCSDETITVYNNAAGVFSPGVYYPAAGPVANFNTYPEAATIADVTGTGNGDVVVTNDFSSDVTILTGNGDGTLNTTNVGYAVGGYTRNPAIVTDINGDGLADILLADEEFSLTWMAGYGDGTFQAARDFYAPIPGGGTCGYGISIASGDFNGDGFTDVVQANGSCGNPTGVTVFLSNPDGSLQPGVTYGSSSRLFYVTVADFNGDGKLDIAASDNNGVVDIFFGTGSGTFVEGATYSVSGLGQEGIVSADFNGDGFPDLAVVNSSSSNVTVLLNDGAGGFSTNTPITITAGGYELAAAQLGNTITTGTPPAKVTVTDLLVAEYSGTTVGVLLGNGDGTFTSAADVTVGSRPYGLAVGDVNGDGFADIVATIDACCPTPPAQGIAVAFGNGDGTFAASTLLNSTLQNSALDIPWPGEISIADIDGDKVPDLVYTNSEFSTVAILFGTGTGTATTPYFFDPVEFPAGQYAYGLTVADLNGDGAPDVATSDDDFAGASTLINANGSAAAPNYSLSTNGSVLNITDGGTGTAVITLTPVNFYSGTVTFSCTGLALDMTCTFAPATLTPVGNAALTSTVTVTTKAPHGALRMPADPHQNQGRTSLVACLTGMGLFGLLLAGDWKNKRNRRVGILLGILVLGMMFSLVGCSSTTPGTPIGGQSVTVAATGSDGVNQSIAITVNVF